MNQIGCADFYSTAHREAVRNAARHKFQAIVACGILAVLPLAFIALAWVEKAVSAF